MWWDGGMRLEENEVLVRWPSVEESRLESPKAKKRPGAEASAHNSNAPEKEIRWKQKFMSQQPWHVQWSAGDPVSNKMEDSNRYLSLSFSHTCDRA